jgi:hypothetical protein
MFLLSPKQKHQSIYPSQILLLKYHSHAYHSNSSVEYFRSGVQFLFRSSFQRFYVKPRHLYEDPNVDSTVEAEPSQVSTKCQR